jgi:hypothetical protein
MDFEPDVSKLEPPAVKCDGSQIIEVALDSPWRGRERRSEVRVADDIPARVKVLDPLTSLGPAVHARVVDASFGGLGLRVSKPVFPGSVVQIRFRDQIVLGEVRYCLPSGSDFIIGIRFREDW